MSKITFRADDDLVERVERLDASKSEVMRAALRSYLDGDDGTASVTAGSLDRVIGQRMDSVIEARGGERPPARDVNVNISVEASEATGVDADVKRDRERRSAPRAGTPVGACSQCGEELASGHVFCPNCGEKATRRPFCECGEELRSDWSHCPDCGRRTASADVLDR